MPTHGIPGTSRAPDGADVAVVELKRPVDRGLVEELRELRELRESAERGEMLLAFEAWKFSQLARRELEVVEG